MTYHKSVLVNEVLEYLAPRKNGVYIDATFGGGGHTRAILQAEPTCKVIAFDWDKKALELNGERLMQEFPGRLQLIWGNFASVALKMRKHKIAPVDGVLADFGTSQYQIFHKEGFSFAADTPLDMRMSKAHYKITAADILNRSTEKELADIFWRYGQERFSRKIAALVCQARAKKRLRTTGDLVEIVEQVIRSKPGRIHPATRVFQALRIAVNHELENIETFLHHTPQILAPGGRLVCISFHSLEDGIVKNFLREHKDVFSILTRRVVVPTPEEIERNSASRSSKLRAAERK